MSWAHILKRKVKTYFISGLLVVGPIGLTALVVKGLVTWMDTLLYRMLPPSIQPDKLLGYRVPGLGFITCLALVILVGMLAANVIGRIIMRQFDRIVYTIPLVNSIYTLFRQMADTTLGEDRKGFRRVVLIEYPRKGVWGVGFVTGVTEGEIQMVTDQKVINVFLPTTPNPTSGFYLVVPEEDVIYLNMTVDNAFKLIISGGMATPSDKNHNNTGQQPHQEITKLDS